MKQKSELIRMNGESFPSGVKGKQILGSIFQSIPNLHCWSYEALRELYVESIKMVVVEIGCTIINSKRLLRYIPSHVTGMLEKIYEMILSSEGLSTLPGFGLSNPFGDNLMGNPERQSIYERREE